MAVRAILGEEEMCAGVAVIDRRTVIALLGVIGIGTVHTIFGALHQLSVVAILTVLGGINEVTILAVPRSRREIGILVTHGDEPHPRDRLRELCELLENTLFEIEFLRIAHGIPRITVPFILSEDRIGLSPRRSFVVQSDHVFAGVTRLRLVEVAL